MGYPTVKVSNFELSDTGLAEGVRSPENSEFKEIPGGAVRTTRSCQIYVHVGSLETRSCRIGLDGDLVGTSCSVPVWCSSPSRTYR